VARVSAPRATVASLVAHVDRIGHRMIQDALVEATADYWRHRGAAFTAARPRPGDFTGRATADQLAARDQALLDVSRACYAAAAVALVDRWPADA
jgi:hypothetical protein